MLDQMMTTYRGEGYERPDLELWSVGFPGTGTSVTSYVGSSTESCFEASTDIIFDEIYGWDKDDLWLLSRDGYAMLWANLNDRPLDQEGNRSALDEAVRSRF